MVFLNLELLIYHYTLFVFQTSQEYFSIQDISCDAYFTNDAPTCIDAKCDTNDGDDAKAVTSLPFFTGKGPISEKVCIKAICPKFFYNS